MSPFILVIFGATGDLAQHKLIPALFSLFKNGQLGTLFTIIGFARRNFTDEEYRIALGEELGLHETKEWVTFTEHIHYQQGMFDESEKYDELCERMQTFEKKNNSQTIKLYYLATPPDNYEMILQNLSDSQLSAGTAKMVRVIIEKPFGKDLQTARELDLKLAAMFAEEQIFRVDHYLGKETVQNMLAFRFANGIFEPVWNNKYIDHVQITFAQDEGIGKRGRFFDGVGILRDVGQNHLMQLLAAVAMEQPSSFTKESVRDSRANAIAAIRLPDVAEVHRYVIRGQYKGYTNEPHVDPRSETETYVAMKLFVESERLRGVPFYVRAGKRMHHEVVDIKIIFIQTCHLLFKEYGCPEIGNILTIRIQPDEGIGLRVIAKKIGTELALDTVDMKFSYHQEFGGHGVDAYEKVLLDIIHGDQMLFNRSDELESSWQLISTILNGWKRSGVDLLQYDSGSWGPVEAEKLLENDGRKWL